VELKGLHRDVARIEQRKRSAAALLNALMGRPGSAPLGPAVDLEVTEIPVALVDLEKLAPEKRPEVLAGVHVVKRGQAYVDAASSRASWPSFMVGVDYWFMPTAEERHAYGAMVSINLPWLNPKHREEVRAAERATAADKRALDSVRNTVRYEVADALARYEAARKTYLISRIDVLPAARQSFEAAQAGFAPGRSNALELLDALQSLLQVRLDEVRELVDLKVAIADLERAIGTDLEEAPITKSQGTHP
jgi:outer membrane protein, heavy metal efflux system